MALKKFWNRGTRIATILVLSSLLTALIVLVNIQYVESKTNVKKVVVATEAIKPFAEVTENMITIREVVMSEVPQDTFESIEDFKDSEKWFASEIGIPKDYPISKAMIVKAKDAKFGPSVELDGKTLFVGVKTDQVKSAGDYIKPGVLVDAYVYLEGDMQRPEEVITPAKSPVLKNLLVYERQNSDAQQPDAQEGKDKIPVVAILKVTPQSAAELVRYQEKGKVYLLPAGYDPQFYLKKDAK